ncbi:MAG: secretin N-terminal domain-containing protein [Synechococcales bacterium]|nr:secretin N-terminal domain-containing protein [Synechococcales bacterium]
MKQIQGITGIFATTIALTTIQPAFASQTQVTNVQVNRNQAGLDVVLKTTTGGKAPQVFNTNRGNAWTAFIFGAKLADKPFQQANPAPGIASIAVAPVNNGVQVTVVGQGASPTGQIVSRDGNSVVLNVIGKNVIGKPGAAPQKIAQATPSPAPAPTPAVPQAAPTLANPTAPRTAPTPPSTIAPPLMPRAVAPPVGDIAISQIDTSPNVIDMGTNVRIPRLVLRDAPAREVLSLLARAAGMNLAFSEAPPSGPQGIPGGAGAGSSSGGPTISLDVENESVQDVFNYVLRIACVPATPQAGGAGGGGGGQCNSLEANRVGKTIFVGTRLPDDARNVISRSLRMNQVNASDAAAFLTTQGAETQRPFEQIQIQTIGEGAAARTVEIRTPTILPLRATEGNGPLILRGLSVSVNDRTNMITLTGAPRKVEIATSMLTQLDLRKRQATVSVKVLDINLLGINRVGTSFSFNINDTSVVQDNGIAVINLGDRAPTETNLLAPAIGEGRTTNAATIGNNIFNAGNRWLGQLQFAIQSQNAKVLTDPTLIIQEGQRSQVKLIEEVITNFKLETQSTPSSSTQTITVEKEEAGLQLDIEMERIDDNGFVAMRINPKISSPSGSREIRLSANTFNTITLLQKREVSTGLVRIRDGQTLVLTGVIQDSDRTTVTKVPILGDIPLLGALFRSTNKQAERREVVVLVTPRVMDDSDRSTFGYGYNPSQEAQEMLRRQQ